MGGIDPLTMMAGGMLGGAALGGLTGGGKGAGIGAGLGLLGGAAPTILGPSGLGLMGGPGTAGATGIANGGILAAHPEIAASLPLNNPGWTLGMPSATVGANSGPSMLSVLGNKAMEGAATNAGSGAAQLALNAATPQAPQMPAIPPPPLVQPTARIAQAQGVPPTVQPPTARVGMNVLPQNAMNPMLVRAMLGI